MIAQLPQKPDARLTASARTLACLLRERPTAVRDAELQIDARTRLQ